ncbi:thioredoxin-like protein [Microdochium bolleyi]|uniref:Glutathione S-transferase kappa n=1 Tax=Microdochium bolleyi TaxID=196109 RepID=A0A136IK91_9PEZI|nr:thioredoxin-like protein [Microdochium bolleyi]
MSASPRRPVITYYFSFLSLWTYLGSTRLPRLAAAHGARIIYKPMDIMKVFASSGGVAVSQRAPQRQAYRLLEMQRWSRIRGLPVVPHPRFYPADPSLAHRVLLAAIEKHGHDSEAVQRFVQSGSRAVWAEERDIADPTTVMELAEAVGLEGRALLEAARGEGEEAGGRWRKQEGTLTQEVIAKRYFGAPVYEYRGEPFWGQDRLEMLDDVISNEREPILLPKEIAKTS